MNKMKKLQKNPNNFTVLSFLQHSPEALIRRYTFFWKISQNLEKNTCPRISFISESLLNLQNLYLPYFTFRISCIINLAYLPSFVRFDSELSSLLQIAPRIKSMK